MAISYDSVEVLSRFADKRQITFPLLSDPDSKVIEAFGIRNVEAAGSRIDGVPYPGIFLLDEKGVIRKRLFYDGYKKRHTSSDILSAFQSGL